MSEHESEESARVEVEEEMVGHRVTTGLHKLLWAPRVSAFGEARGN